MAGGYVPALDKPAGLSRAGMDASRIYPCIFSSRHEYAVFVFPLSALLHNLFLRDLKEMSLFCMGLFASSNRRSNDLVEMLFARVSMTFHMQSSLLRFIYLRLFQMELHDSFIHFLFSQAIYIFILCSYICIIW